MLYIWFVNIINGLYMKQYEDNGIHSEFSPKLEKEIQANFDKLMAFRNERISKFNKKADQIASQVHRFEKKTLKKDDHSKRSHAIEEANLKMQMDKIKKIGSLDVMTKIQMKSKEVMRANVVSQISSLKRVLANRKKHHVLVDQLLQNVYGPPPDHLRGIAAESINAFADWSGIDESVTQFRPPFPLSMLIQEDFNHGFDSVDDQSFVDPVSGFISNQVNTEYTENGWGPYHTTVSYDSSAALGVNYRMPETGIIQVEVLLQNTLNEMSVVLWDNFGLSDGNVKLKGSVYLSILHPNNIQDTQIELCQLNVSSDGDDVIKRSSDLMTQYPYALSFRSTGAFPVNSNIQVYIGTKITASAQLNDMDTYTFCEFAWALKAINIRVV